MSAATDEQPAYVQCDGCGRLLAAADGPTCPECKEGQKAEAREATRRERAKDKDGE